MSELMRLVATMDDAEACGLLDAWYGLIRSAGYQANGTELYAVELKLAQLPTHERIATLLGREGSMSLNAITRVLGVKEAAVRAALKRYEGRPFVQLARGGGRGKTSLWGLN